MITEPKLKANRRNALKSTGPRTSAGKSIVARNAVKHDLLCREVVLPQEDRAAFRAFAVSLCDTLQPEGALEILLADRIIAAAWRLRRIQVIETDLCGLDQGRHQSAGARFIQDCYEAQSFAKLSRYESAVERSMFRALRELERLQRARSTTPPAKTADTEISVPPAAP